MQPLPDLPSYTDIQLETIIQQAEKLLKIRRAERIDLVRTRLRRLAMDEGFTIEQLFHED